MQIRPKLLLCSALLAVFSLPLPAAMDALKPYQWKHRLIVLTLAEAEMDAFRKKVETNEAALRERHLLLIPIGFKFDHECAEQLDERAVQSIRSHFKLEAGSTDLLLIGKDGGLKKRIRRIDLEYLFAAIDAMPMRRAELREQQSGSEPP